MKDKPTVATPNATHELMRKQGQWKLLETLRAGTEAMREAGVEFLPKHKAEDTDQYNARRKRSHLFGAFGDAIDNVASGPFTRELSYFDIEKLDERLQAIVEDADGMMMSLNDFAMQVFDDALAYGVSHFLVDMPGDLRDLSLAEEREMGLHPYFVHIPAKNLFAWRTVNINGKPIITHARWYEYRAEQVNEWGTEEIKYIREWNAPMGDEFGQWALYKEIDDEWVMVDSGQHTYPGVPLVTVYTKRKAFMDARPPFLKLAELNLEHWQKSSDKNNSQHYSLIPMLFRSGFSEDELNKGVVVGVQEAQGSTNPEARMQWVEMNGKSIELAEEDIINIEQRMARLAAEPFMLRRSGNETATGRALDSTKLHSLAQSWVRRLENALYEGFRIGSVWLDIDIPDSFNVNIYSKFQNPMAALDDGKILEAARSRGDLDHQTWLEEMRRRGVLDETVTYELVAERLQEEVPFDDESE